MALLGGLINFARAVGGAMQNRPNAPTPAPTPSPQRNTGNSNNSSNQTPRPPTPPAPQNNQQQYQYANYGSNGQFLGYTTGASGQSNARSDASYVIAPNGKRYDTNKPQNNNVNYNSNYSNMNMPSGNQSNYGAKDSNADFHRGYQQYQGTGSGYAQGMFGGLPGIINRSNDYWSEYSNFNNLEKQHQANGMSDKSGITNPFHYANTGDPFGRDAQKWLKANGYNLNANNGKGLSKDDGTGYAYVDKFGGTHVTYDLITALTYSKDGKVYDYNKPNYGYGYALNGNETETDYGMIYLAGLDGAKPFETWNAELDSVDNTAYKPFSISNLPRGNSYSSQANMSSDRTGLYSDQRNAQGQLSLPAPTGQTGEYAYENYDINGNMIGITYGPSGKSNALQSASYVKAPNGQFYQTANFGSQGMGQSGYGNQMQYGQQTGMQMPQGGVMQPSMDMPYMNPQDYMLQSNQAAIDAQYEAMMQAQSTQIKNALGQTLSDIDTARSGLSAQYDPIKNDIYAQSRVNQQGIEEYMGSLGMEGGQNITAQARNNNATQQAMAQVDAQKQAQDAVLQKAAIDAQRSSSMEELAQSYQVNAQKIQAILQDAQYTNQANLQAMKEAFQFNYQARADELARQQDMMRWQYQMQTDNRDFMYGASQDARNNWLAQQQFEYEKGIDSRDFDFKKWLAEQDQSNWERQFNLSQQKKNSVGGSSGRRSSGGSSGGSYSSGGSNYVDKNTMKASIYSTIDEKLNMVPMGSNGKPQYPGQFNTKAAQRWLDDNRNIIIQELGETAYKTYQTYINKKPSVGS